MVNSTAEKNFVTRRLPFCRLLPAHLFAISAASTKRRQPDCGGTSIGGTTRGNRHLVTASARFCDGVGMSSAAQSRSVERTLNIGNAAEL
jgi:hypothetical protein